MSNVLLIGGSLLFLFLIFYYSRQKRSKLTDQQVAQEMLTQLIDLLDEVVDEKVGQHFSRQDRRKIAMGMIALMMDRKINIEQLAADQGLFEEILLQSIKVLLTAGQISQRA